MFQIPLTVRTLPQLIVNYIGKDNFMQYTFGYNVSITEVIIVV